MKKKLWIGVSALIITAMAVYATVGLVLFFSNQNQVSADIDSGNKTSITVRFESCGGNAIDAIPVTCGGRVKEPTVTRDGCEFLGWYLDVDYQNKFDFNDPIYEDITLYAKWETIKCTVTFDTRGGSDVESKTVNSGDKIKKIPTTVLGDFEFLGWYSDEACTKQFDFNKPITADITLYAKWPIEFELAKDGLSYGVKSYEGNAEEVTIPSSYKNKEVTYIADFAFENCHNLKFVIIPDSVTYIGICAFYGCNVLTTVVIPDSVEKVDAHAFRGCSALTMIYCEAHEIPTDWAENWKDCSAKVELDYVG